MYDVEKFTFNKNKCWFRNNCSMYNTENCNCACKIYFQYYYLVNLANIPQNKQQPEELILQAGDDRKKYEYLSKVKDNINEFVKEGCNLYLYSPYYGNGKTTWAIKLMSKYFSNIWPGNGTRCRGLFINVDEFLMKKRAAIKTPDPRLEEIEKLRKDIMDSIFGNEVTVPTTEGIRKVVKEELDKKVPKIVGTKAKGVTEYINLVKRLLGIPKVNADYYNIMNCFKITHGVDKLEDLPYTEETMMELASLTKKYTKKVNGQKRLF